MKDKFEDSFTKFEKEGINIMRDGVLDDKL